MLLTCRCDAGARAFEASSLKALLASLPSAADLGHV